MISSSFWSLRISPKSLTWLVGIHFSKVSSFLATSLILSALSFFVKLFFSFLRTNCDEKKLWTDKNFFTPKIEEVSPRAIIPQQTLFDYQVIENFGDLVLEYTPDQKLGIVSYKAIDTNNLKD